MTETKFRVYGKLRSVDGPLVSKCKWKLGSWLVFTDSGLFVVHPTRAQKAELKAVPEIDPAKLADVIVGM